MLEPHAWRGLKIGRPTQQVKGGIKRESCTNNQDMWSEVETSKYLASLPSIPQELQDTFSTTTPSNHPPDSSLTLVRGSMSPISVVVANARCHHPELEARPHFETYQEVMKCPSYLIDRGRADGWMNECVCMHV